MPDDDDDLDPFSASFSPTHALSVPPNTLCPSLPTPRDRAIFNKSLPLNNLSACASLLTAPYRILRPKPITSPPPNPTNSLKRSRSQQDIPTLKSANLAPKRGVLHRMHERLAEVSGPMRMLQRAVRNGNRIRIRVRETHGIKGEVVGTLVAFDRHVNVVVKRAVITEGGRRREARQVLLRGENVVWIAVAS